MLRKILSITIALSICIWGYILYKSYFIWEEVIEDNLPNIVQETIEPDIETNNKEILNSKYKSTWEVWWWDTF
jgi:hypothetical protein